VPEALDKSQSGVDFCRELPRDLAIQAFAATRHGLVTTAELRAFGLGKSAVARRAKDGRLFRHHHGVYGVGRPDLTAAGRRMAAVLACGPGAAVSHRSAAALHGLLPDARAVTDVMLPVRPGRPQKGIRTHSSVTLVAADFTVVDGIPCTSVARTLVDLGDCEPRRMVERGVDQAEVLGLFDLTAVEDALERAGPRRGAGMLRRVLTAYSTPAITASELEERMLALVDKVGLPRPAVNVWITLKDGPALRVDFLWRRESLIVETEGRAFHTSRRAFEADRLRDQRLALAGFTVVPFTWRQVVEQPHAVASKLEALLAARHAAAPR
jgi:hypothetical protein